MSSLEPLYPKLPIIKVKAKNLIFPLDKRPIISNIPSIIIRWMARFICARLLNGLCVYHQFGGYTGSLKKEYAMVDAETEQIVHWLLRDVGYSCSVADILEITGKYEEGPCYPALPRMILVPENLIPKYVDTTMSQEHCRALV